MIYFVVNTEAWKGRSAGIAQHLLMTSLLDQIYTKVPSTGFISDVFEQEGTTSLECLPAISNENGVHFSQIMLKETCKVSKPLKQ